MELFFERGESFHSVTYRCKGAGCRFFRCAFVVFIRGVSCEAIFSDENNYSL